MESIREIPISENSCTHRGRVTTPGTHQELEHVENTETGNYSEDSDDSEDIYTEIKVIVIVDNSILLKNNYCKDAKTETIRDSIQSMDDLILNCNHTIHNGIKNISCQNNKEKDFVKNIAKYKNNSETQTTNYFKDYSNKRESSGKSNRNIFNILTLNQYSEPTKINIKTEPIDDSYDHINLISKYRKVGTNKEQKQEEHNYTSTPLCNKKHNSSSENNATNKLLRIETNYMTNKDQYNISSGLVDTENDSNVHKEKDELSSRPLSNVNNSYLQKKEHYLSNGAMCEENDVHQPENNEITSDYEGSSCGLLSDDDVNEESLDPVKFHSIFTTNERQDLDEDLPILHTPKSRKDRSKCMSKSIDENRFIKNKGENCLGLHHEKSNVQEVSDICKDKRPQTEIDSLEKSSASHISPTTSSQISLEEPISDSKDMKLFLNSCSDQPIIDSHNMKLFLNSFIDDGCKSESNDSKRILHASKSNTPCLLSPSNKQHGNYKKAVDVKNINQQIVHVKDGKTEIETTEKAPSGIVTKPIIAMKGITPLLDREITQIIPDRPQFYQKGMEEGSSLQPYVQDKTLTSLKSKDNQVIELNASIKNKDKEVNSLAKESFKSKLSQIENIQQKLKIPTFMEEVVCSRTTQERKEQSKWSDHDWTYGDFNSGVGNNDKTCHLNRFKHNCKTFHESDGNKMCSRKNYTRHGKEMVKYGNNRTYRYFEEKHARYNRYHDNNQIHYDRKSIIDNNRYDVRNNMNKSSVGTLQVSSVATPNFKENHRMKDGTNDFLKMKEHTVDSSKLSKNVRLPRPERTSTSEIEQQSNSKGEINKRESPIYVDNFKSPKDLGICESSRPCHIQSTTQLSDKGNHLRVTDKLHILSSEKNTSLDECKNDGYILQNSTEKDFKRRYFQDRINQSHLNLQHNDSLNHNTKNHTSCDKTKNNDKIVTLKPNRPVLPTNHTGTLSSRLSHDDADKDINSISNNSYPENNQENNKRHSVPLLPLPGFNSMSHRSFIDVANSREQNPKLNHSNLFLLPTHNNVTSGHSLNVSITKDSVKPMSDKSLELSSTNDANKNIPGVLDPSLKSPVANENNNATNMTVKMCNVSVTQMDFPSDTFCSDMKDLKSTNTTKNVDESLVLENETKGVNKGLENSFTKHRTHSEEQTYVKKPTLQTPIESIQIGSSSDDSNIKTCKKPLLEAYLTDLNTSLIKAEKRPLLRTKSEENTAVSKPVIGTLLLKKPSEVSPESKTKEDVNTLKDIEKNGIQRKENCKETPHSETHHSHQKNNTNSPQNEQIGPQTQNALQDFDRSELGSSEKHSPQMSCEIVKSTVCNMKENPLTCTTNTEDAVQKNTSNEKLQESSRAFVSVTPATNENTNIKAHNKCLLKSQQKDDDTDKKSRTLNKPENQTLEKGQKKDIVPIYLKVDTRQDISNIKSACGVLEKQLDKDKLVSSDSKVEVFDTCTPLGKNQKSLLPNIVSNDRFLENHLEPISDTSDIEATDDVAIFVRQNSVVPNIKPVKRKRNENKRKVTVNFGSKIKWKQIKPQLAVKDDIQEPDQREAVSGKKCSTITKETNSDKASPKRKVMSKVILVRKSPQTKTQGKRKIQLSKNLLKNEIPLKKLKISEQKSNVLNIQTTKDEFKSSNRSIPNKDELSIEKTKKSNKLKSDDVIDLTSPCKWESEERKGLWSKGRRSNESGERKDTWSKRRRSNESNESRSEYCPRYTESRRDSDNYKRGCSSSSRNLNEYENRHYQEIPSVLSIATRPPPYNNGKLRSGPERCFQTVNMFAFDCLLRYYDQNGRSSISPEEFRFHLRQQLRRNFDRYLYDVNDPIYSNMGPQPRFISEDTMIYAIADTIRNPHIAPDVDKHFHEFDDVIGYVGYNIPCFWCQVEFRNGQFFRAFPVLDPIGYRNDTMYCQ